MGDFVHRLRILAAEKMQENKRFFAHISKKPPPKFDAIVEEVHEEVFEETDCLSCANCCRSLGPLLLPKDVERIAKHLRMKPSQFHEKYLRVDEDNDLVFASMPCPFLGSDNYCSIYDVRPKACAEYPHTDRKKLYQISALTIKNTAICPAAYHVVERLKKRF